MRVLSRQPRQSLEKTSTIVKNPTLLTLADNSHIPYDAAMSDAKRHLKTCGTIVMISTTETIMITVPAGPEGSDCSSSPKQDGSAGGSGQRSRLFLSPRTQGKGQSRWSL
jgi:hypothetical protein